MLSGPEALAGGVPGRDVYSVSRLNREVHTLLGRSFGVVWVQGELSNFSQPSSGHWYFTLKDRDAQLRCAMFRLRNLHVGFTPRVGMQVLVRGRIGIYEVRGEFQMVAEHLEEAGVGALQREFERLKQQLAAEGLFAAERKRPLPRFPRRIGVITSPTGAALHDILKVLARRYPPAAVLIYPSAVQGAAAVPELLDAVATAAARAECDLLILARGGGSLEDLWAFNDERLARALHACALPVVTGIGHETDFTIADFVADARAPTPSAAAEMAVPDRSAWLEALRRTAARLAVGMQRELRGSAKTLGELGRRFARGHPGVRLQQQMQRLDELQRRLAGAVRAGLHDRHQRLGEERTRLLRCSPDRALAERRAHHGLLAARLDQAARARLETAAHRVALAARALEAVSPLATLTRGFAVVTRAADGTLVTDAAAVADGTDVEARLARGSLLARVTGRR